MKNIIALAVLIQCTFFCGAQWELIQGPALLGDAYGGMSFVNDSTGFIVKFETFDWSQIKSIILKTEDYAVTWDTLFVVLDSANSQAVEFRDVFFINEQIGWVCGTDMPYILKTIDGGETWAEQPIGVDDVEDFAMIKFYDQNYGIAIPKFSGQHAIITSDGGETWIIEDSLAGFDVDFIDGCYFIVNQSSTIIKTFDCVLEYQNFPTHEDFNVPERDGRAVHMIDENTWLMTASGLIGLNNFGSIVRTTDAGQSFQFLDLYFTNGASSLHFYDSLNGFVGSMSGTYVGNAPCAIMKTADGGITWYCQETPIIESDLGNQIHITFSDIECPSPEICYGSSANRISRTFNGGGPLGEMWTGVAEVKSELNKVSVYPNPTDGLLSISGISPNNKSTIKITDTTGRLVMTEYNKQQIDVAHLPSGIYFIEVSTEESRAVHRFVKE